MLEETTVFIDGQYLSLISKHFAKKLKLKTKYLGFGINQLAITLAKTQGLWVKKVFYYTAPPFQSNPPTEEQANRRASYDKFVKSLKKIPNFTVREGRCQKVDGDYHQKGVDTLFTMDLVDTCRNRNIKKIIVLACDTDFVPILNELRKNSIEVILFYFNDFKRKSNFSMSNHILTACDRRVLIEYEHFEKSKRNKRDSSESDSFSNQPHPPIIPKP